MVTSVCPCSEGSTCNLKNTKVTTVNSFAAVGPFAREKREATEATMREKRQLEVVFWKRKYLSLHLGIVFAELPLTYSRLVHPRHNNTKSYRIWTAQISAAGLLNPRPISTIIRQPVNYQRVERCTSATIAPFSWASTAPTISTWGQTVNCFAASFSG